MQFSNPAVNYYFYKCVDTSMTGEIWTAGRDKKEFPEKLRWCSKDIDRNDYLKKDLYWTESAAGKTNSCVYLDFSGVGNKADDPKLGLADCSQRKKFVCEARRSLFLLSLFQPIF